MLRVLCTLVSEARDSAYSRGDCSDTLVSCMTSPGVSTIDNPIDVIYTFIAKSVWILSLPFKLCVLLCLPLDAYSCSSKHTSYLTCSLPLDIFSGKYLHFDYHNCVFFLARCSAHDNRKQILSISCLTICSPRTAFSRSLPYWILKKCWKHYVQIQCHIGDRGSTVVKVLRYKSEGRWFEPRWCHWNFSLT
jgi:hypothetical protein